MYPLNPLYDIQSTYFAEIHKNKSHFQNFRLEKLNVFFYTQIFIYFSLFLHVQKII